jgi:signal recognition particle subunit SRP54
MDALEEFVPDRVAGRILGMGDVVGLVEKAQEQIEAEQAEKQAKRMMAGRFDMNDLLSQFQQMQKMGGMGGLMGMLPGVGKMKKQMDASGMDDSIINRQIAIIQSMTKQERKKPDLLAASRKKRIAAGAGVPVSEINKLMKMHRQMADMMKKVGKMGKGKAGMRQLAGMFGGAGGLPPGAGGGAMPPGGMPSLPPGGLPGMGPGGSTLPPGLAGFGKKK